MIDPVTLSAAELRLAEGKAKRKRRWSFRIGSQETCKGEIYCSLQLGNC